MPDRTKSGPSITWTSWCSRRKFPVEQTEWCFLQWRRQSVIIILFFLSFEWVYWVHSKKKLKNKWQIVDRNSTWAVKMSSNQEFTALSRDYWRVLVERYNKSGILGYHTETKWRNWRNHPVFPTELSPHWRASHGWTSGFSFPLQTLLCHG